MASSASDRSSQPYVGSGRGIFSTVVAGGSGFVGEAVVRALDAAGWPVTVLTRDPARALRRAPPAVRAARGDGRTEGPWTAAVDGADAVVNLAGKGIFESRWNDAVKAEIVGSRVGSAEALVRAIGRAKVRPKVYIGASATGWYGPRENEELDESSPGGNDFLATTCAAWEEAHRKIEALGVRVVILRLGVVLGPDPGLWTRLLAPVAMAPVPGARRLVGALGARLECGALPQLMPPLPLAGLSTVGSGRPWFSWIHRGDVAGMVRWAAETEAVRGVFNATAPEPLTMREFCRVLAGVRGKWPVLPVFGWQIRLLAGGVAEVLLTGQKVFPKAATAAGYVFRHPSCEGALRDLLGPPVGEGLP